MLSAISSGVRNLRLKYCCSVYRLNPRFASSLGKCLESDENAEDSKRRHAAAPDASLNLGQNTKFHQLRGSSGDTFGDLSSTVDIPADFVEGDDADKAEGTTYSREQDNEKRRVHYSKLIAELLSEKKLRMALEILETEMKAVGAKPDRKIFAKLITFCGKVGYPQKAFDLYKQMKDRGYAVTGGTYTSLFNACANCPVQHIGLRYAQRLKKIMDDKRWKPNDITYNAMIKAFGRSGDLETAFFVADEMMRDRIAIETSTINFLLQSCISSKETGFCSALKVWRKMRQFRLEPQVCSYNLMLRCARDCGLGDFESVNTLIKYLTSDGEKPPRVLAKKPSVTGGKSNEAFPWDMADPDVVHGLTHSESTPNQQIITCDNSRSRTRSAVEVQVPSARPNLLAWKPTLGGIVIVDEIKTASDRLLLLGGCQGLIESMSSDKLKPDIKTYTLLLDCIPGTITAEENLLREMNRSKVEPDTGFFNALIYRRGRRRDFTEGFEVLDLMKQYHVEMDNITVHSLAYCVTDIQSFEKFLEDISDAGYSPTTPMLGSVLKNALSQTNFKFIHHVMDAYMRYELKVHKSTFDQLSEFYTKNLRLLKEKDKPSPNKEKFYSSDFFKTGMKLFICKISDWKKRVKLDETSDADYHHQFEKTGNEGKDLEPYLQKWHKGSRSMDAPWRRTKPTKS